MKVMKDIKRMVLSGYVLDAAGRWVPLKQAVASSRQTAEHLTRGNVFDGKRWLSIAEYRKTLETGEGAQPQTGMEQNDTSISLSDERMEFKTDDISGGVVQILLAGFIDQKNVHILKQGVEECIIGGRLLLLVNMTHTRHMSSAGWGVLSAILPGLRKRGGELVVYGMRPAVYEEFVGMQFDKVFKMCETKDQALHVLREVSRQSAGGTEIEQDNLTREEIIRKLVAQNPRLSTGSLRKIFIDHSDGAAKTGFFSFRRILREMDLDTKEKRERFSRSW